MNKRPNPFQPSFQPPQPPQPTHGYPPLPPGPPPAGPVNQHHEWAAYWAAQQQAAAAGVASYPQAPPGAAWPHTQPGAPQQAAYDPALYRNYGYGGQNAPKAAGWQQPPPPPQYAHPQAYPQQYGHPGYPQYPTAQPTAVQQPMPYGPQYPYAAGPMMQQQQQQARPMMPAPPPPPHQPAPNHPPPAKRPRFDSNANSANIPSRPPVSNNGPGQQPPPLHFKPGGGMVPATQLGGGGMTVTKFPPPSGSSGHSNGPRGGGVPLGLPNRGGGQMGGMGRGGGRGGGMGGGGRSGRGGGPMHGHSGPSGGGMGRGGGMSGGRGGFGGGGRPAPRGPASFRQNQPPGRFQGGSNNQSSKHHHHHTPSGPSRHERSRHSAAPSDASSARGPSSGHGLPTSSFNFTPTNAFRGASPFSGTGKRTLTDFRIVGFGVTPVMDSEGSDDDTAVELDWTWGVVPGKDGKLTDAQMDAGRDTTVTLTQTDTDAPDHKATDPTTPAKVNGAPASPTVEKGAVSPTQSLKPLSDLSIDSGSPAKSIPEIREPSSPTTTRPANFKLSSTNAIPIMPRHQRKATEAVGRSETSRIRIYFQCPAELDDKDLSASSSPIKGKIWSVGGKRKKEADDEDDEDDGQAFGKRKREDSNQSTLDVGSSLLPSPTPTTSQVAEHTSPHQESENEQAGAQAEQVAANEDPVPTIGDDAAQTLPSSTAADEEQTAQDMSMVSGNPEEAGPSGENFDQYVDYDVDAEGEDDAGGFDPEDDWGNQMSWAVEGQTPIAMESSDHLTGDDVEFFEEPKEDTAADTETAVGATAPEEWTREGQAGLPDPAENGPPASTEANPTSPRQSTTTSDATLTTSPDASHAGDSTVASTVQDTPLKEESNAAVPAVGSASTNLPSPNRISISYAGSARRLVVDADVIETVKIRRAEGRIDVTLLLGSTASVGKPALPSIAEGHEGGDDTPGAVSTAAMEGVQETGIKSEPADDDVHPVAVSTDVAPSEGDADQLVGDVVSHGGSGSETPVPGAGSSAANAQTNSRGILIDAFDESTQAYRSIQHTASETDQTIPPFPKYLSASTTRPVKVRLVLFLDKEKPLSEPKWVKTGDIEDWLKTMFGPAKQDKHSHASWSGRIIIADPDPPPTVYALIDNWVQHSMFGPPKERRRFVNDHLKTDFDNVMEILLRLARREGHASNVQAFGNPLGAALPSTSLYANQQTPLSLAVLSLFRLSTEYAKMAGVDGGAVETRVGQLIRALPQSTVFKILDSMFKDWLASQKKGPAPTRA